MHHLNSLIRRPQRITKRIIVFHHGQKNNNILEINQRTSNPMEFHNDRFVGCGGGTTTTR